MLHNLQTSEFSRCKWELTEAGCAIQDCSRLLMAPCLDCNENRLRRKESEGDQDFETICPIILLSEIKEENK